MRVQQVAEDLFNKQKHQQNHAKPSTSKSDTHKLATHGNTWQHALEDYEELSEHHRTSHQRIAGSSNAIARQALNTKATNSRAALQEAETVVRVNVGNVGLLWSASKERDRKELDIWRQIHDETLMEFEFHIEH